MEKSRDIKKSLAAGTQVAKSLHHQLRHKKDQPERNHDNSLMCLMMGKIELNGQLQKLNGDGLKLDSSRKDRKRKFPHAS